MLVFCLFLPLTLPRLKEFSIKIWQLEIGVGQYEKLQREIKKERDKIDEINATTQNTLLSLASLVIANPIEIPSYKGYVDQRVRDKKTVIVGCQDYTEQRLLCAIVTEVLRRSGDFTEVVPKYDLGGAGLNFIALSRGDVDIWPSYTWQGFEMVFSTSLPEGQSDFLKLDAGPAISKLNEFYGSLRAPLRWFCPLGFINNWALVMPGGKAEKLRQISDLAHTEKPLRLGCERGFFARPEDLMNLVAPYPVGYGISFQDVRVFEHSEVYDRLSAEEVDVIVGFTTDSELYGEGATYRVLEDDVGCFGNYHATLVGRKEFLDSYPDLQAMLLRTLEGQITAERMSRLIKNADRKSVKTNRKAHIEEVEENAQRFVKEIMTRI